MKSTSTDTQQVCGSCDKPVSKNKVSLTAWIFGDTNCRCPIPNLKPQTPVVVAAISAALTTQTPPATLVIAERYEVLTPIGEGGMGTVYKVRDIELDAIFAVKTLRKELVQEPQASKRFEQEVEAARELNHANLVTVYDHGLSLDQTPYLVMDFIDGPTLAQVLGQEHSLEPAMALNIFVQICDAVDHAHEHGVIHRDLKPSNIMVVTRPDQLPLVKVVDFGIAKVLPTISRETLNLTKTGEVFGSPIYMSPEQCMGERLDTRSDIYSLGCLMYETLTGSPPFKEENSVKTIVQHLTEQPKPCGVMATGLHVPPDLEKVVMRCLEKDPSARYQSASELLKELQAMQFKYWKKGNSMRASIAFFQRRCRAFFWLTLTFTCLVGLPIFTLFVKEAFRLGVPQPQWAWLGAMTVLLVALLGCCWSAFCLFKQMRWCNDVNEIIGQSTPQDMVVELRRGLGDRTMRFSFNGAKPEKLYIYFRGGKFPDELEAYFDGEQRHVSAYIRPDTGAPLALVIGKYLCIASRSPLKMPQ